MIKLPFTVFFVSSLSISFYSSDMVQLTDKSDYSYSPGEFDIDIGDDLSQTSVSVDGASVKVKTVFSSGPSRPENTYVSVGEKSSFAGAINYEQDDTSSIPGVVVSKATSYL